MRRGITLVDIMIAVAVIIILVSLAVPNILRSRILANEVIALTNTKTIANSCLFYHATHGSFPGALVDLSTGNPPYIDSQLASGTKQGYEYRYNRTANNAFTLNANPVSAELLRGKYYYADESGIVRSKSDGPAGPGDQMIE